MSITFGSLFTGIGGFDLGLEFAGLVCEWQVEIDDKCQDVLARRWPNTERHRDVRECGERNLKPVDLVCGGFPCQDLSVAGKRAGLAGERSGLWFEFHRILAELKPRWIVIENVPGLLSSNGGRDFAIILQGLVQLGYGVCWRVLDAQYSGVPQRRRRVFIVGHLGDGRAAQVLFESEGSAWDPPPSRKTGQRVAGVLAPGAHAGGITQYEVESGNYVVADPVTVSPYADNEAQHRKLIVGALHSGTPGRDASDAVNGHIIAMPLAHHGPRYNGAEETLIAFDYCLQGSERTYIHRKEGYAQLQATRPDAIASSQGVRRLTPTECERLQGFPDGWTANGQSDTARYKQLGNAVCVPVSEWLGKRLIKALRL